MAAHDPESLSESDLKVIFVEIEVNFALIDLLNESAKTSPPASIDIGLIFLEGM